MNVVANEHKIKFFKGDWTVLTYYFGFTLSYNLLERLVQKIQS